MHRCEALLAESKLLRANSARSFQALGAQLQRVRRMTGASARRGLPSFAN